MEEKYIPKIQLFKQRSFGEKFNVTFDFLKENFGPLFKIIMLVEAPMILIISVVYTIFLMDALSMSQNTGASIDPVNINSFMSSYAIMSVLGVIVSTTFFALVFRYMRLYQTQAPSTIKVKTLLPTLFRDSAMIFGVYILFGIVVVIGFFFFLIPGLYLAVAFSMAFSIVIFEDENAFQAMSKSISLSRGKWWSTFGLLFVTFLIQMVLAMLFSIPMYSVLIVQAISIQDQTQVFEEPSQLAIAGQSLLMAISYLGLFLTNTIGAIAISFQYFNLREKQESVGLMKEIDDLNDDE